MPPVPVVVPVTTFDGVVDDISKIGGLTEVSVDVIPVPAANFKTSA